MVKVTRVCEEAEMNWTALHRPRYVRGPDMLEVFYFQTMEAAERREVRGSRCTQRADPLDLMRILQAL